MSRILPAIMVTGVMAFSLLGCGGREAPPPEVTSRPVKIFVVEGGVTDAQRTFPGRIDAAQRAELAFRVPGQLQEILVKEGDLVEEKQVIARLDPTDFDIALKDRQATFDNAQSNFERAKELIVDGNISRMDYDNLEANFRTAQAALSQAQVDLEYTVLEAPFKGRIARRSVENFEDVLAKQTVFTLQNVDQLDVVIDLPESVVRMVRARTPEEISVSREDRVQRTVAYAVFEGQSDQRFALTEKEIATKADEQTQTFRATFTMDAPTAFTVLPGMTANVLLDFSQIVAQVDTVKRVPVRAVQADSGLDPRVWVLDPDSMTVSSKAVTIGRMTGRRIEVTDGLYGGEEIVAVGAPFLAEGMKVTRMAQTEQAVPREDDPH